MGADLDLETLAAKAGVSPRTVRYYIHQRLLPSPGKGPYIRYDEELVDRLRLIKEYQAQHLPLAEIRKRLDRLDAEGVRAVLGRPLELPLSDSALSYVKRALGEEGGRLAERAAPYQTRSAPPEPHDLFSAAGAVSPDDQWQRVRLSPKLELHIQRPLSPAESKLVNRVLDLARRLLSEEP